MVIKMGHSNQGTQIRFSEASLVTFELWYLEKRGRESFGQAFTLGQRPRYIRILESFSDSDSPLVLMAL